MALSKGAMALAVVALALGVLALRLEKQLHEQEAQLQAVQAKQAQQPREPSMDEQRHCAEAAEKAFARLGYDSRQNPLSSYENHYSQRLNRCFISTADTHTGKDTVAEDRGLLDALESKQYGSFIWVNSSGKKFWEVKPTECWVLAADGTKQTCTSRDEYETLLKPYMES